MNNKFAKLFVLCTLLSPLFAYAAPAASCVVLSQGTKWDWKVLNYIPWAYVHNTCSQPVRVRMIWAWAGDGPCTYLASGEGYREEKKLWAWKRPYVSEVRKC